MLMGSILGRDPTSVQILLKSVVFVALLTNQATNQQLKHQMFVVVLPLAVLSLQVYVPLSSSCTEFSNRRHL